MDWIPALVELFREHTWQESEFRFRVSERMDVTGFSEGSCILTFIVHMADDEGVSWTVAMPKVDVDLQALLIEGVWSLTHFLRSHMWLRFATQTPTRSAGLFEMNGCKHEHPLVAYFKLFGWLCSGTALQGHLNGSKRGKWGWFVQSVCESKRKTKNIQRDFTTPLKLLTLASYKCSDCTGRKNKEQMWFENHASVLSHSFMSKKKKRENICACLSVTQVCGVASGPVIVYWLKLHLKVLKRSAPMLLLMMDMRLTLYLVRLLGNSGIHHLKANRGQAVQKYPNQIHLLSEFSEKSISFLQEI